MTSGQEGGEVYSMSKDEFEKLVTDTLAEYDSLPEFLIRKTLAEDHGMDPGEDQGRGPKPLCESEDFETREHGYMVRRVFEEFVEDLSSPPGPREGPHT